MDAETSLKSPRWDLQFKSDGRGKAGKCDAVVEFPFFSSFGENERRRFGSSVACFHCGRFTFLLAANFCVGRVKLVKQFVNEAMSVLTGESGSEVI